MSAEPLDYPGQGWTTDEEINANVRAVVREYVRVFDIDLTKLAEQVAMSRSTLYDRLSDAPKSSKFTAAEVYRIAKALDVEVDRFFQPADELQALLKDAAQNWKIMNGDLRALSSLGQGELPFERVRPVLVSVE